jgi:hypothetical protein
MQRKIPGDDKFTVPEAGMMGSVISDNSQVMNKGRQISFILIIKQEPPMVRRSDEMRGGCC